VYVVCLREVFVVKLTATDGFGGSGFTSSSGAGGGGSSAWNMASLDAALAGSTADSDSAAKKKGTTAEEFLGSNANLVNLNELIVRPPPSSMTCASCDVFIVVCFLL